MRLRGGLSFSVLVAVSVAGGCSLANAPDEVIPFESNGAGAAGGTGGSNPTMSSSSSGATGGTPCMGNGECADMADDCNDGVCNSGTCEKQPKDAGTSCGSNTDNDCTDPDTCDADGNCLANDVA